MALENEAGPTRAMGAIAGDAAQLSAAGGMHLYAKQGADYAAKGITVMSFLSEVSGYTQLVNTHTANSCQLMDPRSQRVATLQMHQMPVGEGASTKQINYEVASFCDPHRPGSAPRPGTLVRVVMNEMSTEAPLDAISVLARMGNLVATGQTVGQAYKAAKLGHDIANGKACALPRASASVPMGKGR